MRGCGDAGSDEERGRPHSRSLPVAIGLYLKLRRLEVVSRQLNCRIALSVDLILIVFH